MSEKVETDRRGFLKLAGLGTVAGGAAIASTVTSANAKDVELSTASGYRETEHVKTFYESARF